MKRLLSLFLVLILLCGCATPSEPGEASVSTTQTPETTAIPTEPAESILPATQPPETTIPPTEAAPQAEPQDSDFVRIRDYLPTTGQSLPYATTENFTGQVIYEFTDAWLRYGTVKKLLAVKRELWKHGLSLLIWDGFRPTAAQFRLWEVCPDPTYVANPETGFSAHSRGNTVDLTLLGRDGLPVEMPTGFDDFSPLADRDYSDCTPAARENALLLQTTMEANGFTGYFGEWWHFSDTVSYPVEESFTPVASAWLYANCDEFITLRTAPSTKAEAITRIPAEETFLMLARSGAFVYVEYQGLRGYVLESYTSPVSTAGDSSP